ncbi:MAG TPA: glycosyltransferase family 2 protein [Vicinamibacterales bacterium]|nr:glycosyltransferase family 2 protein [Vicinamibacterales bacterium]
MRLSVVATLYRSSRSLEAFHARVSAAAACLTDHYEIVLVNDGSPDDSLQVALRLLERDPRVRIVDLARNFGHHKAMMTGLGHARGELVFLIDSDLEEEPELLRSFHETLRDTGADVVYGVQAARRGGPFERLSGWVFFKLFNLLSDQPIPVNVVTVRLMTRRYVSALVSHQERETMIAGLWALTGFDQVPVTVTKGLNSGSSYSLGRKVTVLVNSVTSFSDRPLVFIFYLGVIIGVGSASAAVYLVVQRLFFGVALPGWPSLIVSVWMLGGLMLGSLGIIGMYVSRIFIETKQRPYTIVRQIHERAADAAVRDPADGRPLLR